MRTTIFCDGRCIEISTSPNATLSSNSCGDCVVVNLSNGETTIQTPPKLSVCSKLLVAANSKTTTPTTYIFNVKKLTNCQFTPALKTPNICYLITKVKTQYHYKSCRKFWKVMWHLNQHVI